MTEMSEDDRELWATFERLADEDLVRSARLTDLPEQTRALLHRYLRKRRPHLIEAGHADQ